MAVSHHANVGWCELSNWKHFLPISILASHHNISSVTVGLSLDKLHF